MNNPYDINRLTDQLFRREAGRMVAVLTRIFGTENLQLSEDVVQETFINAIQTWSLKGVPDNPSAWLFRAARNKAIDLLRRNKFSQQIDFSDPERALLQSEYTLTAMVEKYWQETAIGDDLLRMMYACCHPEITEENQITLILKTLCGFSTSEIAKAFVTSPDTISKRLYRTKEFFRNSRIQPGFPPADQLQTRTHAVLRTIYLIFNEGYNATHANEVIRKDLISQAMYLCNILCTNLPTPMPEVFAAMALMYFHAARIDSRIDDSGNIMLLWEQDRSKWNQQMIREGNNFLNKAAFGDSITSYHIEAAIAYEHCQAATFADTNWKHILRYYNMLVAIHPTPIVLLNRIMVIFKLYGAEDALAQIEADDCRKEWEHYHLYHSLMGDIYAATDKALAISFYQRAADLTQSAAEKRLLQRKMDNL